jgi:hypothetical protein
MYFSFPSSRLEEVRVAFVCEKFEMQQALLQIMLLQIKRQRLVWLQLLHPNWRSCESSRIRNNRLFRFVYQPWQERTGALQPGTVIECFLV